MRIRTLGSACALLLGSLSLGWPSAPTAHAASCPWVQSNATPDQKAKQVIEAMKARDKDGGDSVSDEVNLLTGAKGDYIGNIAANKALCIPALNMMDGPAGVRFFNSGVTQLPAPAALAATWSTDKANEYGKVIGEEVAGKGGNVSLGPTVNIVRDPRWGRAFEALGEDAYLSGKIGAADIKGVQYKKKVMAQVKHLAAYNQETNRTSKSSPLDNAVIDTRTLQEIYLPQFQDAVKAGVASVMCSYNKVTTAASPSDPGGKTDWACENQYLQKTVFKDQFGFPGFITSDWRATHHTGLAANNGLDVSMPGPVMDGDHRFGHELVKAVKDRTVDRNVLDGMVRRVLREMFDYGLFGKDPAGSYKDTVTTPEHVRTAKDISEEGTVLLKNSGVLPLDTSTVHSVAVIGDDAGDKALTHGGGSAEVDSDKVVTPYQGIKDRAAQFKSNSKVEVRYATSNQSQAVDAAQRSDVAVVFVSKWEGEGFGGGGDLRDINLSAGNNSLIKAVAGTGKPTIVVLNTGSAVTMPWLDQVDGVFEAWYPGQEDGNAIAALLFGDVNPSGKLPVTFPKSLADVPASSPAQWTGTGDQVQYSEGNQVGYRWYDAQGKTPLFPFGYGLSYTKFEFSDPQVTPPDSAGKVTVTATVKNSGPRAGSEVVQLYLGSPSTTGEPPRRLRGFTKVALQKGASRPLTFTLTPSDYRVWSTAANNWTTPGGTYTVYLGDSSKESNLRSGTFTVNDGQDPTGETVAGVAADLCLDNHWASGADNSPITIYPCNGTIAQKVTATSDNRLKIQGKCVTANKTPVQLYSCTSNNDAQIWEPQSNGSLFNPQSKKCLDVPGATRKEWTQLQIYECNGSAAQRWRIP